MSPDKLHKYMGSMMKLTENMEIVMCGKCVVMCLIQCHLQLLSINKYSVCMED